MFLVSVLGAPMDVGYSEDLATFALFNHCSGGAVDAAKTMGDDQEDVLRGFCQFGVQYQS